MLILGDDEMKEGLSQSEAGTAIRRMAFPLSSSFRISSQRFQPKQGPIPSGVKYQDRSPPRLNSNGY